ncbi:lytic transglycosylase domain-containing protein [Catenulispora subtropica]|uniref:Transglycosylase SLT domain-containing protein n=1 Tax=Catenulispora subtropica TaxID=450798 RepID=A0ABN2RQQ5_9ACTN
MSGISGSGRHVASHAKPGKMTNAKGKVKTAAAVTSVLAVSGGVATAFHLHQDGLRNSTEAAAQDSNQADAAAAAGAALAARSGHTSAADRDLQRADLNAAGGATPGVTTPGSPTSTAQPGTPTPTSDSSSSQAPSSSAPTSTSTTAPSTTSKPTVTPTKTTTTPSAPATSSSSSSSSSVGMGINATPAQAQAIAKQLVPSGQYACFANIISRESSWNVHATNPSSGAYGLGQALPGDKMAPYGSDWRNSATIQIKWALAYMTGRYGSPCAAWTFWQNHSWY